MKDQMFLSDCLQWSHLKKDQHDEQLTCAICLQMMTKPLMLSCSHVFGCQCIKKWMKNSPNERSCPICRTIFNQMSPHSSLTDKISFLQLTCPHCQVPTTVSKLNSHLSACPPFVDKSKKELEQIVGMQRGELQKEITPHLKQFHGDIFRDYVKQWSWLGWDGRDWKWWWWSNNPWWEHKSCLICNKLWHRYQFAIQKYETRRVQLIKTFSIKQPQNNQMIKS